jgi:hypothetical protein
MTIKLDKNTITPELRRLMAQVRAPAPIFQAGAKAIQVAISKHLKALQARPNAKGWPPQYFFAGGPASVERNVGIAKVSNAGAEITIADPRFVHRITGGVVSAKRRKLLAIPLTAEAYAASGKGSIRHAFPGLKVLKLPKGVFLVREVLEKRGKGKLSRLLIRPLFRLVPSVTHRPHPDERPPTTDLAAAARKAMTRTAHLLLRAEGPPPAA